ncbi:MAG: hypothetical protein QGH47_01960 [Candidatus Woesearchaeota archaeon]|nr:hypothetical protein [Candidatus Woesearchaeota archaeon]
MEMQISITVEIIRFHKVMEYSSSITVQTTPKKGEDPPKRTAHTPTK